MRRSKQSTLRMFRQKNKGPFPLFFLRYWWVLCFILMVGAIYYQTRHQLAIKTSLMESELKALLKHQREALDVREDLLMQVKSHQDPRWIERVLMKELGVIPEGQIKVYFHQKERGQD